MYIYIYIYVCVCVYIPIYKCMRVCVYCLTRRPAGAAVRPAFRLAHQRALARPQARLSNLAMPLYLYLSMSIYMYVYLYHI